MKKLVFIFAAMTVLAFAACTETKAPEAPVEDNYTVEDVEDAAVDAAVDAAEDAVETFEEDSGDAPADAAKDAAKEGVRDDISVKK